jgi:hypothetical protein
MRKRVSTFLGSIGVGLAAVNQVFIGNDFEFISKDVDSARTFLHELSVVSAYALQLYQIKRSLFVRYCKKRESGTR